jgi:homoserine trans-succinylase
MPRASHVFSSFFYAKGVWLIVEEYSTKESGDIDLLQGEKRRILNFVAKHMKYQIPSLPEEYIEETKQNIEAKYTINFCIFFNRLSSMNLSE